MYSYSKSLLLVVAHRRYGWKRLAKPYCLTAIGSALFVVGAALLLLHFVIPVLALSAQGLPFRAVISAVGVNILELILLLIGALGSGIGLWSSHRASLSVLKNCTALKKLPIRAFSSDKRLLHITLAVALCIVALTLVSLPLIIISVGIAQTALSGLMLDEALIPVWVFTALAAFTIVGVLFLEIVVLYLRIVLCSKDPLQ